MKKTFLFLNFFLLSLTILTAQPKTFSNPIIPGFHPDPSICRVGNDYYLVTSSFEWYPGLPIYHSTDLMNWEQIGYVLNRPSQLQMKDGLTNSAGLWAPTIRYHQGKFYVINTAQQAGGNFYVSSEKPEGPYSEPTFLTDAPGIDPSLFFDDDGTCWYTGSINDTPEKDKYPNEDKIYLQQLDLTQGKLVGKRYILTTGLASNSPYAEAPHIYKINGKYFLMVAEGGTWNNHAITMFQSDKITGPYIPGIANPVLSHRQLGSQVDITTIGHGDLVQTQNGDWWCVMLGVRPYNGLTMLGRETFITPVSFQDGWPVFNPGVGRVLMQEKVTGLPYTPVKKPIERDEFASDKLDFVWSFLRTPFQKWYELKNGQLQLNLRPERVHDLVNPSLIARRIEHINFDAALSMNFASKKSGDEAGMIIMQNGKNNYRLVVKKQLKNDSIILYKTEKEVESVLFAEPYKLKNVVFKVEARGLKYKFYVGENELNCKSFGNEQDASINSSNKAGGFIGPFIGMYASSNGNPSNNKVLFDWFEYKAIP
jgi:xylan 1,4-beta-xylosidase